MFSYLRLLSFLIILCCLQHIKSAENVGDFPEQNPYTRVLQVDGGLNGCYDVTASEDKASEDELATQLSTSSVNQAKTQTTEIEEDTKFHPQETEEDLNFFREQLDGLGVLELFRKIGGDLTKIPRAETVYALRIDEAIITYIIYLTNKYDTK